MPICDICNSYYNVGKICRNPKCFSSYTTKINSRLEKIQQKKTDYNKLENNYYEYHYSILENNKEKCLCLNCGDKFTLIKRNEDKTLSALSKCNISHILPKNKFKSIADDKDNCIYLCIGCHLQFDKSIGEIEKMKVFDLAKRYIKSIFHKIKNNEKNILIKSYSKFLNI